MDLPTKHIVVLDGEGALGAIAALSIRKQHKDDRWADSGDARERIGKHLGPKHRHDPLQGGRGSFDGIDDPSPSDDVPQFTPQEEQEGPDDSPSRAIVAHPASRTVDNMQVYRVSQRYMYGENAEEADLNNNDPNHLEYWMDRPVESLDAVIIPSTVGPLAYDKIADGLKRLKDAHPGVKIIQISEHPIDRPELVDVLLIDPTARQLGDAVRDAVKMPRLPQPDPQDIVNRTQEEWRLKELNKGRYTIDTLPPWLKRKGDPGWVPPTSEGDQGKPGGRNGR